MIAESAICLLFCPTPFWDSEINTVAYRTTTIYSTLHHYTYIIPCSYLINISIDMFEKLVVLNFMNPLMLAPFPHCTGSGKLILSFSDFFYRFQQHVSAASE